MPTEEKIKKINGVFESPSAVNTPLAILYRNKKLYSEADKEVEDLDFSTLDVNLPTTTNEEMAALYADTYNRVFNDPSYVDGDIQDPDMKALYDSIYKKVFG